MALHQRNPNPNKVVKTLRKAYNAVGFNKGYNAILAFIFGGAWFGFILARAQYLNVNGEAKSSYRSGSAPGEWYWFRQGYYNMAIQLHLYTVIPCGLLALVQFVPYIRRRFTIIHRINGYIVLLLLLLVNISALMLARRAFGGSLATQTFVGILAILTTGGSLLAWLNIRRLQIDQHRAWMLRVWFYIGTVITQRLIMILIATLISKIGSYYQSLPCEQVAFTKQADALASAACVADPTGQGSFRATFGQPGMTTAGIMAAFQLSFGAAGWLALLLHAIGIEVYLRLTPAENERLRQVSLQRQTEKGFARAGSAGLTADRLGDSEPWRPRIDEKTVEQSKSIDDEGEVKGEPQQVEC